MNHQLIIQDCLFSSPPCSEGSTNDEIFSKENSFAEFDLEKHQNRPLFHKSISFERTKKIDYRKYKTEICRTWLEKGFCPYGSKCLFAHGKSELLNKEFSGGYKSKLCRAFHNKFYCPYGSRCIFIHQNMNVENIAARHFYTRKINSAHFNDTNGRRLRIFKEITGGKSLKV